MNEQRREVKMDRRLTLMFLRQAWYQCEYAMYAAREINANTDVMRRFYAIERLLTAAANISKILWGSSRSSPRPTRKRERKELPDLVGLGKTSILRPRIMRDHFEHFDARIEEWADLCASSGDWGYADMNALGAGPLFVSPKKDARKLRHFDPHTNMLYFFGQPYDLAALMKEIIALKERIEDHATDDPVIQSMRRMANASPEMRRIMAEAARVRASNNRPNV
jgi:hypothetical protein